MKSFDYLRPAPGIVFAVKFFNGANYSYQISGAPVIFGTKKAAAKFVRENFSGDARRIRLYDLNLTGRKNRNETRPSRADIDAAKVAKLRTLCRNYKTASRANCLDKVWNCGRGRTRFIEVCTETETLLYNTLVTRRADIENIKNMFPQYQPQPVNLPYYETCSLSYYMKHGNN